MKLRSYQTKLKNDIQQAWADGHKNVLAVLACGGGKTPTVSSVAKDFDGVGMFIAHRGELLGQLSVQFARDGIYHDLLTPKNSPLRRRISDLHLQKVGKNFINDRCNWYIGGVDTVVNMTDDKRLRNLGLIGTDEAHHMQRNNKWGKVRELKPNALNLGVTATPIRSDGKPLDMFDVMVESYDARQLIKEGYLVPYEIVMPLASDLDLNDVAISSTTGDYNLVQVKKAIHASKRIVGDVVRNYLEYAKGKKGITFAVDVEEACKIAAEFNANGVPAEVISAKTPPELRSEILRQFEKRKILQLVNVDLFGEGFDIADVEVVSLARPTMSLNLFIQQVMRVMRLMISPILMAAWDDYTIDQRKKHIAESLKPKSLIIDHVGNCLEHGLPDEPHNWYKKSSEKRNKSAPRDTMPLHNCLKCLHVFEKCLDACPFCGEPIPLPKGRVLPAEVDGDLFLLTEEVLEKMRNEIARIDNECRVPHNLEHHVKAKIIRTHVERQAAQSKLRETIALWAGKHSEFSNRINHKRFFLTFGITVPEAKVLNTKDAEDLYERISSTVFN